MTKKSELQIVGIQAEEKKTPKPACPFEGLDRVKVEPIKVQGTTVRLLGEWSPPYKSGELVQLDEPRAKSLILAGWAEQVVD